MPSLLVTYPVTADAFMKGYDLHANASLRLPFRIAVYCLAAFFLAGGALLVVIKSIHPVGYLALFMAAGWLGGFRLLRKIMIRRTFGKRKDLGKTVTMTFSDEDIHLVIPDFADSRIRWEAMERAVIGQHGILLYIGGGTMFYWLPYIYVTENDRGLSSTERSPDRRSRRGRRAGAAGSSASS